MRSHFSARVSRRNWRSPIRTVEVAEPNAQEKAALWAELKKDTPEEQHRDCESCGYATCADMIKAMHNGVNIKDHCVHYVRFLAEEETQKLAEIREKEQQEQAEAILPKISESIDLITNLLGSIHAMTERVATIAANTEEISSQTTYVQELTGSLREDVEKL